MNCNKKSHFDGVTLPRRVKDLVMSLFARSRRWSGRREEKLDGFSEEGGSCSGEGWEEKKKGVLERRVNRGDYKPRCCLSSQPAPLNETLWFNS